MHCFNCGEKIQSGYHFCPRCGKPIAQIEEENEGDKTLRDENEGDESNVAEVVVEALPEAPDDETAPAPRKRARSSNASKRIANANSEHLTAIGCVMIVLLFFSGCFLFSKAGCGSGSRTNETVFWYEMVDERSQTVDVYWGGDRPVKHITIKSGGRVIFSSAVNPPIANGKVRIRKPYDNLGLEYDWRH